MPSYLMYLMITSDELPEFAMFRIAWSEFLMGRIGSCENEN